MSQSTPSAATSTVASSASADTRLTGPWLIIARTAWLVLVIPSLGLFIVSLFVIYQQNKSGAIPAAGQQQLTAIGLSLGGFAVLNTIFNIITSAIWYGVGFFIFWRRSDDWLALLAAFTLVMFNVTNNSNNNVPSALAIAYPALSLPLYIMNFLGGVSLGVFFLFFPGGRLAPRWMGLILLLFIILEFLGNFPSPSSAFDANWPAWLLLLGTLVVYGAIIFSQVYRYRRVSTPVQRQQTKWVILGLVVAIGVIFGILVITFLLPSNLNSNAFGQFFVTFILWPAAFLLVPLSIGFSILRYRLYDIDLLINRTLVYITLTVILALIYFGSIVGLQALLRGIINATNNSVAIVVSTLVIAAIFQPLRHRIQAIIDHRFYRRKYDAARTIAAFNATLRNEVDLAELSEHLVSVVEETMQPKYVSLWLRPTGRDKSGRKE